MSAGFYLFDHVPPLRACAWSSVLVACLPTCARNPGVEGEIVICPYYTWPLPEDWGRNEK